MANIDNKNLQAVCDYYLKGLSAKEISSKLGVSIDSVYYSLRKNNIQRRTAKENNDTRFENKQASFEVKKNLSIKEKKLFIAGIMLYWAEGSKWSGEKIVDFANSDSEMVKIFLMFLRKICGISESKLRIYLYCYEGQDIDKLISHWSKLTGISKEKFSKPYIKKSSKSIAKNKMLNGLVHIRYGDKKLLNLIRSWIKEISSEF